MQNLLDFKIGLLENLLSTAIMILQTWAFSVLARATKVKIFARPARPRPKKRRFLRARAPKMGNFVQFNFYLIFDIMYSHIKVIKIFLRVCSYVLKKEIAKKSII